MQSLRGFGYSPETAMADLVDNSIAASANTIDIEVDWNEGQPRVAVLDDGRGFDLDGLVRAMCFGGSGPGVERADGDLGRFGLGLKTASLSQCRRMTVAGRRDGRTVALVWDVDSVVSSRKWEALIPETLPALPLVQRLERQPHGTVVIWERMDAIGGLHGLDKESFFLRIQDLRAHLGMVFHRFLGGDARHVAIAVNGRPIRPWDPCLRTHAATITLQTERLRHDGALVSVTPYVLPHRDRFANDAEHEAAGGPGGWSERQGFYVYRGKRLVVAGGWLGLGGTRAWTREESSRLARITIDLPPRLDEAWRIDVKKSLARPPGALRARLTALAAACRDKAREVFAWRGGRARTQTGQEQERLWIAEHVNGRLRYRVSRVHPLVRAVSERLGNKAMLDGLLALIEQSVPVERIWLDVSEADGAGNPRLEPAESAQLAAQIAGLLGTLRSEAPVDEMADQLIRHLPVDHAVFRRTVLELMRVTP